MEIIREGSAKIKAEIRKVVTSDMEVFYNPVMQTNRDITIMVLDSYFSSSEVKIGLPLAGSGIRGVRILKEIKSFNPSIYLNDRKRGFLEYMREVKNLNDAKELSCEELDANLFMEKSKAFDYIDIDPFGSPNPFLDSAIRKLKHNGLLGVTATDTAALSGTYPKTCMRKYWAIPRKDHMMHETGLRILVRKVQLVGAQYDKALIPVLCYYKDHYFRLFLRCTNRRLATDGLLKNHVFTENHGPLWKGKLYDPKIIKTMEANEHTSAQTQKFLDILKEELDVYGFFDIHILAKGAKISDIPRRERLIEALKKEGYDCTRTHFSPTGIKTDADKEKVLSVLKSI